MSPRKLLAVLVLFVGVSCKTEPPHDAEQDVTSVLQEVLARFEAADADGLLALYSEDAVWMLPNRGDDLDKPAALAYYRELFERMRPSDYTASRELKVAGDFAFARVTYRGTLTMVGSEDTRVGLSRHITVLRREPDGSWRVLWDIFNLPPTP